MINRLKHIIKRKLFRSIGEKDIDIKQLKKMVKEGSVLIDVRSPQEYEEGHIEKAISIPEYEIIMKIEKEVPDKNQNIIVYCTCGIRSKKAQDKLNKLGYNSVYCLYEGLKEVVT